MSLPGNPFGFGNDISQYQQKVRDFYTVGYNRRNPSAHPKGAYRRPVQYANVVWNGEDGRQSTICRDILTPGAIKKRDDSTPSAGSELEPADICANYTISASATSRTSTKATPKFTSSKVKRSTVTVRSSSLMQSSFFFFLNDAACFTCKNEECCGRSRDFGQSSCDDFAWYYHESECDAKCFPQACTEVVDDYSNAFPGFVCECKS